MEFTYEQECFVAKTKAAEELLSYIKSTFEPTDVESLNKLLHLAVAYSMQCEELAAAQRLTRKETKQ